MFYYAQYGETAVEPIYYRVAALGPETFQSCTIIICDYFDRFKNFDMSHDYWKFSFFVLILTNKNIKILMIEICRGLHLDNVLFTTSTSREQDLSDTTSLHHFSI